MFTSIHLQYLTLNRDVSSLPQLPNSFKVMTMLKSDKDLPIPTSSESTNNMTSESGQRWTGGLLHLWLAGNKLRHLPLSDPQLTHRRQSSIGGGDRRNSSQDRNSGGGDGVGLSLLAPALTSLDVSSNRLFGPLPPPSRFPSKLVHLDLSNNQISSVGMSYDENRNGSSSEKWVFRFLMFKPIRILQMLLPLWNIYLNQHSDISVWFWSASALMKIFNLICHFWARYLIGWLRKAT